MSFFLGFGWQWTGGGLLGLGGGNWNAMVRLLLTRAMLVKMVIMMVMVMLTLVRILMHG